jgi:3-oxoacyl-[acyl-carrier protein] reductase
MNKFGDDMTELQTIDKSQPLKNSVALITGASRGIGAAVGLELGRQGATVIGTATSSKGAEQISKLLQASQITGAGMALDVNDPTQIETVLKAITEQFGDVTILVNNAGITRDTLLMRMKEDDWDQVLSTNLTSVYRMSQAVLRAMMKARAGRIISISSVVGHMGNAGQTNYAAAKAGMTGFTKSLAREVGSRGITVNCIAPGFIDTDMTRELPETVRNGLLEHIPLGRLGHVQEIAAAVAFLASPLAGYISGETLHINGGMYMA